MAKFTQYINSKLMECYFNQYSSTKISPLESQKGSHNFFHIWKKYSALQDQATARAEIKPDVPKTAVSPMST